MNILTLIPLVHKLAEIFESLRIRYAFGEALANNYWGTIRATQDIDVLVLISALRYQEIATALTEIGFTMLTGESKISRVNVQSMVAMINERHLFTIWYAGLKVEIFVSFLPLQEEALKRAIRLPFEGKQIYVTSAEDLIIFKMIFHREKDLRDIKGILWSQRSNLDIAYLRQWAAKVLEDKYIKELESWIKEYI